MVLLNKNNRFWLWLAFVILVVSAQFLFFIFFINNVYAQTDSGGEIYGPPSPRKSALFDPLGGKTIFEILNKVIGYLIKIGAPIVALMVIYGGFLILTAGDKPEQVTNGKNTILYAAIGYAIIICSWGIIYIIREVLGANFKI